MPVPNCAASLGLPILVHALQLESGSVAARQLSGWDPGNLPQSIMTARWPESTPRDLVVESEMGLIRDIVREVRATRSHYGVEPGKFVKAVIMGGSASISLLEASLPIVSRLARLDPIELSSTQAVGAEDSVSILVGDVTLFLPLGELTDPGVERQRLGKELEDARRAHVGARAKLSNESFLARAPDHVVAREKERASALADRIERLEARVEALSD